MASWMVHLRVADELLKKIENLDERAFSIYEESVNYGNVFMDIFSKEAFENRRRGEAFTCDKEGA